MPDRADWSSDRHAMLVFAVQWAPYGGGTAEDIWATFGVSARTYFHRLRRLLSEPCPPGLDAELWHRLQRLCTDRLTDQPVT